MLAFSNKLRKYHLLTFGCQMNQRDSQWLASALNQRGFQPSAIDMADLVILNTCSVREKPERKVLATIDRIAKLNGKAKIAVLGCVAQQLGSKLQQARPNIILVAGGDSIAQTPEALEQALLTAIEALLSFSDKFAERPALARRLPGRSAYVNIMQGCDNFCAYCIVPYTRGRQRSRQAKAVLEECAAWLEAGNMELTLLGQNVNAWGLDLTPKDDFTSLLRKIAALPGLQRLRFVTPHPKDLTDATIACFSELPNLCPRLHLPLQAGSDRILAKMGRKHGRKDFLLLVDKLRAARPDIALSTDLIVGFPGESEADFQQTLDLVQEVGFMSSYSFCYSDRPGTKAALLPDKILPEIQLERLNRLQHLQDDLGAAWLANRVGDIAEILIERPSPRKENSSWQGRDEYGACVNICLPEADNVGKLVKCRITTAKKHSLVGEVLKS